MSQKYTIPFSKVNTAKGVLDHIIVYLWGGFTLHGIVLRTAQQPGFKCPKGKVADQQQY